MGSLLFIWPQYAPAIFAERRIPDAAHGFSADRLLAPASFVTALATRSVESDA
jgi:hypothetical protein